MLSAQSDAAQGEGRTGFVGANYMLIVQRVARLCEAIKASNASAAERSATANILIKVAEVINNVRPEPPDPSPQTLAMLRRQKRRPSSDSNPGPTRRIPLNGLRLHSSTTTRADRALSSTHEVPLQLSSKKRSREIELEHTATGQQPKDEATSTTDVAPSKRLKPDNTVNKSASGNRTRSGPGKEPEPLPGRDRAPRNEAQPADITYALSVKVDQVRITGFRDEFFTRLQALSLRVKVNKQSCTQGFSPQEAASVTDFLFTEVIGSSALKRLSMLVRDHNRIQRETIPIPAIARAEQLRERGDMPMLLRQYFDYFSRAHRLEPHANSQVNTTCALIMHLETYNTYRRLLENVEKENGELVAFLKKAGYKTKKRGVGMSTCIGQYICDRLGVTWKAFNSDCRRAESVASLADLFSEGIITILPHNAVSRIQKWGYQRMDSAFKLFNEVFPYLRPVAQMLEKHVYQPIRKGYPIPIDVKLLNANRPIEDTIEHAIRGELGEAWLFE